MASSVPTLFVRFEDLRVDPAPVLTDMFKFILDVDSLEGTLCERRIKEVTSPNFNQSRAYAIKSASPSLCRNRHLYSEQ